MRLDDVANDRQPETEAASHPGRRAVRLSKLLEEMGEKARCDPLPRVAHRDARAFTALGYFDLEAPALGRALRSGSRGVYTQDDALGTSLGSQIRRAGWFY